MKSFFMLYLLFFSCLSYTSPRPSANTLSHSSANILTHPFTHILYELSAKKECPAWYSTVPCKGLIKIKIEIPYEYIKNPESFKSNTAYQFAKTIVAHKNQLKPQQLDHDTQIVYATLTKEEKLKILFSQVVK